MLTLRLMTFSFWCGFLVHGGLLMAYQDWLGLESYIEHVNKHWIDLHWLVGFTVFLIVGGYYLYKRGEVLNLLTREEDDSEEVH